MSGERFQFPTHLVVVGDSGMGEHYVLNTSRSDHDGESPVALWVTSRSGKDGSLEVIAPDFGSFLWDASEQIFGPT